MNAVIIVEDAEFDSEGNLQLHVVEGHRHTIVVPKNDVSIMQRQSGDKSKNILQHAKEIHDEKRRIENPNLGKQ